MRNQPEFTGFPAPDERRGKGRPPDGRAPPSPGWMTQDLLDETRRVLARAYGRSVTAREAVEVLANIRRLASALIRAKLGDGP